MRILHIINSLNPAEGGTVESLRQVGSAIAAQGHAVEVLAAKDTADDPWIESFPLRVHCGGPGFGRFAFAPKLRSWLFENGGGFDVWIINGLWQYPGLIASRTAKRLGVPYFVYPHGMLGPWGRLENLPKYIKKLVYWIAVERKTLGKAEGVIFSSDEEARLAPGFFNQEGWRTCVVQSGVSEPPATEFEKMLAFRKKYALPDASPIWLFLGRVHPVKGLEDLLTAFPRILNQDNPPVLLIAGSGDPRYVATLEARSNRVGHGRIVWVGPLNGDDKWVAFNLAELFILPSHHENFGIAVAEALSAGVPVCITQKVNIWRDVEMAGAGLHCGDNAVALEAALLQWRRYSIEEKAAFKIRARSCFEENFRVSRTAGRLLDLLGKAMVTRDSQHRGTKKNARSP